MALFHELREDGKTVVMVTHDEKLARNTTRILRMRDGLLEGDEVLVEGSAPPRRPLGDRHQRDQERRKRGKRSKKASQEDPSDPRENL
jgi:ABC-type lipoprotein export system ATPase subunit